MHVVTWLMTSSEVLVFVVLALMINTSTAFSLYDASEFPIFDKRVAEIGSWLWETWHDGNDAGPPLMITDEEVYSTLLPALVHDDHQADSAAFTDMIPRRKRYTEYQENALAMCAGECMYKRRSFYGECYELCNWNGMTSSPWKKLDKQSQQQRTSVSSRVPTHRFGPPTSHHSSPSKSPAVQQDSSGGGKIKIVAGRPMKPLHQSSVNGPKQPPASRTISSKQNKLTVTTAATVKDKVPKIGKCSPL